MGTRWRRWSDGVRSAGVVGAVLVVGLLAEWSWSGFAVPSVWVADLAVGVFIAGAAAVVLWTDDGGRVGWLLALAAMAWFAGNFATAEAVWVAWIAGHLALVHRAVIAHTLIVYPAGRVKAPIEWATILLAYVGVLIPVLVRDQWWTMLWATGLLVAYLGLVHRRTALARAAGFQALPAMVMFWASLMAVATIVLIFGAAPVPRLATFTYEVGIVATIALFVARMADWRRRTAEVADAVVEITYGPASNVRDLLAQALRDPTVEVVFAVPGGDTPLWVDELGRAAAPLSGGGRAVVPIRVDGRTVAELASEVDFDGLPNLLAAVGSATGLAAQNARLRSRLRRQVELLEASRLRLLSVADEERLHLGEQLEREAGETMAQMHEVLDQLPLVGDDAIDAATERSRARLASLDSDLHGLAAGLGPAVLTRGGLTEALGQLAESGPMDIELSLTGPIDRVQPAHARTIYFVCAEAIANAVRHSRATSVVITLERTEDRWALTIVDDGCGGADMSAGTGLQGLADRVRAVGGQLHLDSPRGAGTRLTVGLPSGEPDGTE